MIPTYQCAELVLHSSANLGDEQLVHLREIFREGRMGFDRSRRETQLCPI